MPLRPRRFAAALAAAAFVPAIAGCGSSDDESIPKTTSDNLIQQLDGIQDAVAAGECDTAQTGVSNFRASVQDMPPEVDSETESELGTLAEKLSELSDQCAETGATGTSGAVPTDTSEAETSTTSTSSTSTTTTTATESSTTEEEEQPSQSPEPQGGPPSNSNAGGTGTPDGFDTAGSGGIGPSKPKEQGR